MKLQVEIKDSTWIFKYQVGENEHTATRPIDADSLCAFTAILQIASRAHDYERKEYWDEIKAMGWVEKNKDKAKELLDKK